VVYERVKPIIKTNHLNSYREIIVDCFVIHAEQINTMFCKMQIYLMLEHMVHKYFWTLNNCLYI